MSLECAYSLYALMLLASAGCMFISKAPRHRHKPGVSVWRTREQYGHSRSLNATERTDRVKHMSRTEALCACLGRVE